ncbi:MAG: hypothetical protein V2B20_26395 [Pseudomonadota bacterium]
MPPRRRESAEKTDSRLRSMFFLQSSSNGQKVAGGGCRFGGKGCELYRYPLAAAFEALSFKSLFA